MRDWIRTGLRDAAASACLLSSLVCPLGGQGDRARDVVRITVLQASASTASRDVVDGFRRRLEQLGRRSSVTVIVMDGEQAAAPRASADLVVALGARAQVAAAKDFRGTPTVGALVTREAMSASGTGASVVLEFAPEVELDWMRRLLPQVRRIGVVYSTDANARLVARAREIGRGLGFEIIAQRVANPSEIPAALNSLAGTADVLWGIPDDLVLTSETARAVLLASLRTRVPFVGLSSQWVRAGAVYALDRDYADIGAQAADLAVRVLDGAAGRAPEVVSPRKVTYSLNTRSADLMRVTFPGNLIRGAVEVVR